MICSFSLNSVKAVSAVVVHHDRSAELDILGPRYIDYYPNDQNDAPGPSPHYSTQDSKLIRHTIAGLIEFVGDDQRNEWSQQADPHIVVGDEITGDHLDNCDCAVEITMKPPLIILKTTDPDRKEN
jgi:hypothetical protein